jgi:hypothetical protein
MRAGDANEVESNSKGVGKREWKRLIIFDGNSIE